jgi:hypothetical protein
MESKSSDQILSPIRMNENEKSDLKSQVEILTIQQKLQKVRMYSTFKKKMRLM